VSVRKGLSLYETFHARPPDFVTALDSAIQLPEWLGVSGQALRIWYASDKWRKDGEAGLYVHPYESTVYLCEPWREGLRRLPSPRATVLVLLGLCVAVEVKRGAGDIAYPVLPDVTELCATEDGRSLVLLDRSTGILGAIVGEKQRITDRGIEG
jgi:hypothetical protein